MICDTWDAVSVPFPFTDSPQTKRRPALVLSSRAFNDSGHAFLGRLAEPERAGVTRALMGTLSLTSAPVK